MSVKVRLTRTGANRDISFRVVAADTRFPRDGRVIENLGWYSPRRPEGGGPSDFGEDFACIPGGHLVPSTPVAAHAGTTSKTGGV